MILFYIVIALCLGLALGWYVATKRCELLNKGVEEQLITKKEEIAEFKSTYANLDNQNLALHKQLATLETVNKALQEKLTEQETSIDRIQEKLSLQFKNLANDLLDEKSKKFTDQNKANLETILKPLSERLQTFEKQVEQSNKEGLERNVALRTEITKLYSLNLQITKEAENLTKAIKGEQKTQGNWGELILETILEQSGLVKDREYQVQPSILAEGGKRYQPDIIIKLPTAKQVIIDAKVSLTNYEQFFNTEQKEEKANQLKKHLLSIRRHIQTLSEKNYQNLTETAGLDFVLLFIPIEGAFNLVMEHDYNLIKEAYERNIILTSPTTLIATLRTIASIWKQDYQNQNAIEIARQSGALYDKFVSFVEDLKQVGKYLENTQKVYIESMQKLYEGRDNLVRKTERIKLLGANTTKSIDKQLLERAQHKD